MFQLKSSIFALAFGMAANVVYGAPIASCDAQANCIKLTAEQQNPDKCGSDPCQWKVCLKLVLGGVCAKSASDTVSHSCKKPSNTCISEENLTFDYDDVIPYIGEIASIGNGDTQCQIVGPGQKVQFLLKDGNQCAAASPGLSVNVADLLGVSVGSATCQPMRTAPASTPIVPSCTNNQNSQRECLWEFTTPACSPTSSPTPSPTARGDPHFKTWSGETYDFHGVCDLVMLTNPDFDNGIGMDIHLRTEKTRMWSYIKTASVRVGDDTLEVTGKSGGNRHWVNGVEGAVVGEGSTTLPTTIAGYAIHYKRNSEKSEKYVVDLGDDDSIVLQTWNSFVSVTINSNSADKFGTSLGLMGSFHGGVKLGRDNATVFDDDNAFGAEWQVQASEPKLFHNVEGPQFPASCEMPSAADLRRRLGQSTISMEDAKIACARVDESDFDLCVFDVLATNDKTNAGAY